MSKSKNELQEQLEIIRNSIGHFPDGAAMEDILAHSNLKLNELR
jgi:hypothetical protein